MADKPFQVEVITPDRCAMKEDMVSLQFPASDGLTGVLANHAPLISTLVIGELHARDTKGKEHRLAVGEGFVEVLKNNVKVLSDFADFDKEIDVKRAEEAKKRAEERLKRRKDADIDVERAELALKRALLRLKLGGRG